MRLGCPSSLPSRPSVQTSYRRFISVQSVAHILILRFFCNSDIIPVHLTEFVSLCLKSSVERACPSPGLRPTSPTGGEVGAALAPSGAGGRRPPRRPFNRRLPPFGRWVAPTLRDGMCGERWRATAAEIPLTRPSADLSHRGRGGSSPRPRLGPGTFAVDIANRH